MNGELRGRLIAVPETRELDLFAELLQRRGAKVLRCPLVAILDAPDPAPVLDWIEGFAAGGCDDLILLTGEGLRRMLSCIDRHRPALRPPFVTRLAQVRRIARGPKPGRVLRTLGLKPDLVADPATTDGLIALLRNHDLQGRRVGVQLYGSDPNPQLMDFLDAAGAQSLPVAPYVYADAAAEASVVELIGQLAAGRVDAIAFTSASQVDRLFRVAATTRQSAALGDGLRRCLVAAIGPVVSAALESHGISADVTPEGGYFLKPLTQAIVAALEPRGS